MQAPTVSPAAPKGPGQAAPTTAAPAKPAAVVAVQPRLSMRSVKPRHRAALLGFLIGVIAPCVVSAFYLFFVATDQYHSDVAFSTRSEEKASAAAGLLGALTQISSGTASDLDILHEYIASQRMIEAVDAKIGLREIYRKPSGDPVFALGDSASIEDLIRYWNWMVHVSFDQHAGIISVRAEAFSPEDARSVARAILEESSRLVNDLSEQARQDAIRFAGIDLAEAEENLRNQRKKLAEFRGEYRIVDPEADVAGQMGLLSALQTELAQALVERDTLLSYVDQNDQRVVQANRRIDAITSRIAAERTNLGIGGVDVALTDVIGRYEELRTDLEFASAAYTQALTNLTLARAEARRQARYLAVHIEPTLAEESLYPRRGLLAILIGGFLFMAWSIVMIFYYNVRDTR